MTNATQSNAGKDPARQNSVKCSMSWGKHGMNWKKLHRNHNVEILALMLGVHFGVKGTLSTEAFSDRLYDVYGWDLNINTTRTARDNYIQDKQVLWSLLQSVVQTLCLFVSMPLYSAYSDARGRTPMMVLGLGGMAIAQMVDMLVYSRWLSAPVWLSLIGSATSGLLGAQALYIAQMNAVITDTEQRNRRWMFVRFGYLSLSQAAGTAAGGIGIGYAIKAINYEIMFSIMFIVLPLMTLLTPVLVPILAPPSFKAIIDDIYGDAPTAYDDDEMHAVEAELRDGGGDHQSLFRRVDKGHYEIPKQRGHLDAFKIWKLTTTSVRSLVRRRPNNGRLGLLLLVLVSFLAQVDSDEAGTLINIYTRYRFGWEASDLGTYTAFKVTITCIAMTASIVVFKGMFDISDTYLLVISFVSLCSSYILLTFVNVSWLMYLVAAAGSLQYLAVWAVSASATRIVSPDEMGRVMAAIVLMSYAAILFANAVLQNIYRATLSSFSATVFVIMAVMSGASILLSFWIHRLIPHALKGQQNTVRLEYGSDSQS